MKKASRFNIWELIKILLAISLIMLIIAQVNLNDLVNLFRNVSPGWLIASFVVYFLMSMTKALQYYILIGDQISYPRMLYIVIVQNTVSNFIANSAGIASYLATLKVEEGIKVSRAAIIFVITKVMDVFFYWFIPVHFQRNPLDTCSESSTGPRGLVAGDRSSGIFVCCDPFVPKIICKNRRIGASNISPS